MMQQSKFKERALALLKNPLLPFFALWVLLFAAHLGLGLYGGDEEYYGGILSQMSLGEFIVRHYNNWSPRTLLEIVEIIFSTLPWFVWRVVNPLVAVSAMYCLSEVIGAKDDARTNWVLCGLLVLYRWEYLSSAGWISTTLVYLWPAAACLAALVPLVRQLRGQKTPLWRAILGCVLLAYGCNMEQCVFVYAVLLAGIFVYTLLQKKKPTALFWAQAAIATAMALYSALCPGEHARYQNEIVSWFKEFGMLSVFSKFEIGLSFALKQAVFTKDFVFMVFCILLCLVIWYRNKNILYRILGVYPMAVVAVCGFYRGRTGDFVPLLNRWAELASGIGTIRVNNCNTLADYLPLLVMCSVLCVCIVDLYLALGHTKTFAAAEVAFLAGFASYGAMGFTPTIAVSGPRTGFAFSLCVIGIAALLYRQIRNKKGIVPVCFYAFFAVYLAFQIYSLFEM